jgi:flagellar hook assembly protein FlgD
MVAGVGGAGPAAGGLRVGAAPNPARSEVTLGIEAGAAGRQDLAVYDVTGRTVRRFSSGWFASGNRFVRWDGRNDTGVGVPPGTYLVIVREGARTAHTRVTLLR